MSGLQSADLAEARVRSQHSDSQLVLLLGESPDALRTSARLAASELDWPVLDLNIALASPGEPSYLVAGLGLEAASG